MRTITPTTWLQPWRRRHVDLTGAAPLLRHEQLAAVLHLDGVEADVAATVTSTAAEYELELLTLGGDVEGVSRQVRKNLLAAAMSSRAHKTTEGDPMFVDCKIEGTKCSSAADWMAQAQALAGKAAELVEAARVRAVTGGYVDADGRVFACDWTLPGTALDVAGLRAACIKQIQRLAVDAVGETLVPFIGLRVWALSVQGLKEDGIYALKEGDATTSSPNDALAAEQQALADMAKNAVAVLPALAGKLHDPKILTGALCHTVEEWITASEALAAEAAACGRPVEALIFGFDVFQNCSGPCGYPATRATPYCSDALKFASPPTAADLRRLCGEKLACYVVSMVVPALVACFADTAAAVRPYVGISPTIILGFVKPTLDGLAGELGRLADEARSLS